MGLKISIQKTKSPKQKPASSVDLGFGRYFTDHMFLMNYSPDNGWHNARVVPYEPLQMDPAACVFHYAQTLFEGLKAYRTPSGKAVLFRPQFNCERMHNGAKRICIPAPDINDMFEGIKTVVAMDQDWIPATPGHSLYIRPTLMGTQPFLGVRPSEEYLFFVILSPVGSYYSEGVKPVKIWVEKEYVRAALGGLGAVKAGANYAQSLYAAQLAKKSGYSQVLWLDAHEHKYVEEVGTMNVFFRINDEIITPPLGGTILGGVTRNTVLQLLKDWNLKIVERRISIQEVIAAQKRGELKECFGTGTAAIISPVGELKIGEEQLIINDSQIGELSQKLFNEIIDIQTMRKPDQHSWIVDVPNLK